ncbi:MAG: TldD/PmbA family protein [Spirochaetes bacterium]|nr:TldD/PmbA family protein [Spirochaetota bacterium]NLJ04329.1 TldD/PmbA family protein [Exilispira sp.]MBP8991252.1 TldD/PmbA family protein [Spirochaetota bacterium]HOV45872.1 TldD/PmbA family protein [Exilispira sp.]HPO60860.1 TldD/PmbA family protein [Exilispira sp.]
MREFIDISYFIRNVPYYLEIREQSLHSSSVSIMNNDVIGNSEIKISGISARSFLGGKWGFASSCQLSENSLKTIIDKAIGNAKLISRQMNNINLPSNPASFDFDISKNYRDDKQSDFLNFLFELEAYIKNKYPLIKSRTLNFHQAISYKNLVTSDGSYLLYSLPRAFLSLNFSIEKNGEPYELSDSFGGIGKFCTILLQKEKIYELIDSTYLSLIKKSEGVYAEPGLKELLLGPEVTGNLAHEAIGHTVEADIVLGGSIAKDFMNKIVASEQITLVDFSNKAFSDLCPVPIFIDDEGTSAVDVTIIENGILKSYLSSKQTAHDLNIPLTGNARANLFCDEPIVRMRNTAILPKENKLEDMISSIDDGYYLIKTSGGEADTNGEFMFEIDCGYKIKNGKISSPIKDTIVLGNAFEVLKSVDMVGDDFKWDSSGYCGKKQPISVSVGGPSIRCKAIIGGR